MVEILRRRSAVTVTIEVHSGATRPGTAAELIENNGYFAAHRRVLAGVVLTLKSIRVEPKVAELGHAGGVLDVDVVVGAKGLPPDLPHDLLMRTSSKP
jgi:hypothetical protein